MDEEFLSASQLHDLVNASMHREVSRKTIYRWRAHLGFRKPPYRMAQVEALAYFGNLLGVGVSVEDAIAKVMEKFGDK